MWQHLPGSNSESEPDSSDEGDAEAAEADSESELYCLLTSQFRLRIGQEGL